MPGDEGSPLPSADGVEGDDASASPSGSAATLPASGSRPSGSEATLLASGSRPSGSEATLLASGSRPSGSEATLLASGSRPSGSEATLADSLPPSSGPGYRASMPSLPPAPEHRYQLGAELGRGGMGRVVEAFDTHLGRTVALKEVVLRGDTVDRRFQREVKITARLEHASIVPLYDAGMLSDGRPFYVMRRVSGQPLDRLIAGARRLEDRLALVPNVLAAIDAMAHAHRRGVIHRDLKPANILVGDLGETVVIDWGLAKVIGDRDEPAHDSLEPRIPSAADSLQTQIGAVFGTPGFMAPEQARGDELGPPGDVYALGATLYQLLAARPPIAGTSADEVIEATLRHRIEPVSSVEPGAPAELVTIVDKALSFQPGERYPSAAELADDVRRFLTGQLVGAHRYTRRQRLLRFARRHRAAVAVALLAVAAVVALSWYGLRRIVDERDAAMRASREAQAQRERANERAEQLRARSDQMLVQSARGLVERNPTQAIAMLKQLSAGSAATEEALAVARGAVMRGVAHGLPSLPGMTTRLELSVDGARLLQIVRGGRAQILDLGARRVERSFSLPQTATATWAGGDGRLLVEPNDAPPFLLEPASGAREPLAIGVSAAHSKTARADRFAIVDDQGRLALYDVATRALVTIPTPRLRGRVELASDGAWVAAELDGERSRGGLLVVDRSGTTLARLDGEVVDLAASPDGKLAVRLTDAVYELEPAATPPVSRRVPLERDELREVLVMVYRGSRLHLVSVASQRVWDGRRVVELTWGGTTSTVTVAAGDLLVAGSGDGRVHAHGTMASFALAVTRLPDTAIRIATSPSSTRIVALAGDALLLWDLAPLLPRVLEPPLGAPLFATEELVVQPTNLEPLWAWWDLGSGRRTQRALRARVGLPLSVETAPWDGRVAVRLDRGDGTSDAVVAYPDGERELVIPGVVGDGFRLVEGDGLVFVTQGGRVMGQAGAEAPRELVAFDGDVVSLARRGRLGFAALSERGELVRGRLDGSGLERARVDPLPGRMFVAPDADASTLVALGDRLLRWSATLEEVARLPAEIRNVRAVPSGVLVTAGEGEHGEVERYLVAVAGDPTPRRVPLGVRYSVSEDGSRAVSLDSSNQLEVVELPSRTRWTIPSRTFSSPWHELSPSGRRLVQGAGTRTVVLELPAPHGDLPGWLDSLTNAHYDDGELRWRW